MATLDVINMQGETVGQLEVSDTVFNAPVKEHLLWEVVVAQRAGRRAGSASTKTRAQVSFTGAKVYRQKGTGNARHGSKRAPIFVGGGAAHGPKPRSYAQRTPKKVRQGGLVSAISLRNREAKLLVLEDLAVEEIKTKHMAQVLAKVGVDSGLIVEDATNLKLIKSVRNLANAKYIAPEGLNVYDVLRYKTLVLTKSTVKQIEERLSR